MPTEIEWCDEVWNPVTGCTPISEGCAHCYAKRMSTRLKGRFGYPEDEPFRVTFHPDKLDQPLKWRKPRRVFVCSMGDLFHKNVAFSTMDCVWDIIHRSQHHTFLILTKRPARLQQYLVEDCEGYIPESNLYLGISAENQQTADERIPILLQIPAAKRFVSLEPLLGPVPGLCQALGPIRLYPQSGKIEQGLDWVIIGGLSLPGGKVVPPVPEWIDSIVEQCDAAGVPLFIKENAKYPVKREEFPG